MSTMSDIDLRLREAGIDPASFDTIEEAIEALRLAECNQALDDECRYCEIPELGIKHYWPGPDYNDNVVVHCSTPCKLLMMPDDM